MFIKIKDGLIRVDKHCKLSEAVRRNVCMKDIF